MPRHGRRSAIKEYLSPFFDTVNCRAAESRAGGPAGTTRKAQCSSTQAAAARASETRRSNRHREDTRSARIRRDAAPFDYLTSEWEGLNPPGPEFHTRTTASVTSAVFDTCACAVAPQPYNFRGASTRSQHHNAIRSTQSS